VGCANAGDYWQRNATLICAVHESAFGTKRTSRHAQSMSAFGGKADIGRRWMNVRIMGLRKIAIHYQRLEIRGRGQINLKSTPPRAILMSLCSRSRGGPHPGVDRGNR